jgi:hypothetical protein
MKPVIDGEFLGRWHPRYDEVEDDQKEYDDILPRVANELSAFGSLSERTFIDIIEWKAARVKGSCFHNPALHVSK